MVPKSLKNYLNIVAIIILIMSMIPGAIALPASNTTQIIGSNPISITELYVWAAHEKPNHEYVKIINNGKEAINIKGWKIKDEGEKHTYVFPNYILKPKSTVTLRSDSGTNIADTSYINTHLFGMTGAILTLKKYLKQKICSTGLSLLHIHFINTCF